MYRTLIFLAAFFWFAPAYCQDRTIYWAVGYFPPFSILEGDYASQGFADAFRRILFENLRGYKHELIVATTARSIERIQAQPNVCSTTLLKTPERERMMEFSTKVQDLLPNGVVTLRAKLPLFQPFLNERGELRLAEFLSSGNYRLGVVSRSFGQGIDRLLKRYEGEPSIVIVPSTDHFTTRLQKLVTQHEFDAILGYANELQYAARSLNLAPQQFAFLHVAEEPGLISLYVACSQSATGRRVIDEVNRVLADPIHQQTIKAAYRYWLDAESANRFEQLSRQARSE
jgi:uncharacterized protein (TIGR02285 family)